jgi:diguanylate cyclase (GGDEF)-like protein
MGTPAGRSFLGVALIVAAAVALGATLVAGYQAQRLVIESSAWVEHTTEVRLAIADSKLGLERAMVAPSDRRAPHDVFEALRGAERAVRDLTVDNPAQQSSIARGFEMTDRLEAAANATPASLAGRTSAPELESLFDAMDASEVELLSVRRKALEEANVRTSDSLAARAVSTIGLAALALFLFWRQTRAAFEAQRRIHQERAVLASVLDSVGEGVLAMTPARELLAVNEAARTILGESFPTHRLAADWRDTIVATREDGTPLLPEDAPLARAARGEAVDGFVYHLRNVTYPGPGRWLSASSRPIRDESGNVMAGVVTLRDITEQKRHAEELRALSLRDELTQLYNRRGFLTLAEQHLRIAVRTKAPFAVLYADLNGLKRINDELGHETGDRAIVDAARVLKSTFRDSDIVARLGGDEFVVLIADVDSSRGDALVRRATDAMRGQNDRGLSYRLSVSMGLAFYDPADPRSLEELIAEADECMYSAKRGPRSSAALRVPAG